MFLFILIVGGYVAYRLFNAHYPLAGVFALIAGGAGAFNLPERLHARLPSWQYGVLEAVSWMAICYLAYRFIIAPIWLWLSGKRKVRQPANETGAKSNDVRAYESNRARYSFKDVMGMEDLKKKLREAAFAIKSDGKNGILLSGDPGNGKSFIAEALAGELDLPFIPIAYGDVASKWINQTTEQVVAVFDSALRAAPCLLFLDEIDSLIKDRNSTSGGNAEQMQITNAILTKLVDLRGSGVIIVAATNYLDLLDRAAIREGRFDFKIEVSPPDYDARLGLLSVYLGKGLTYADGVRERIARRWEGFSNARIRTVVEVVSKEARKMDRREVSLSEVMEALREVQGSAGNRLPEGTKSIEEMSFPEKDKEDLQALAHRMIHIDEVESVRGSVPKGVLFFGAPGTGKTATAKALAKSSGWAFLPTTGQELLYSADKVAETLKKANDLRPCIVFIDEADDILQDRSFNPQSKAGTNNLLASMDGVTARHDVMFIAATNYPETLDTAAMRRFPERFEFRLPDEATMKGLVSGWMKSKSSTPFASDFTPDAAARLLMGLSPSDAYDSLQKAINLALSRMGGSSSISVGLNDLTAARAS